mgnify:CR=1 FL=1
MWWHNLNALIDGTFHDPVSICIENGIIQEVREGPAQGPGIDLQGLTAIPGLVDVHGDMFEREIHPRPKANIPPEVALYEVDKRLANSGVTTAFAARQHTVISKCTDAFRVCLSRRTAGHGPGNLHEL